MTSRYSGERVSIEISDIEVLALKELAIICGALAQKIPEPAASKQRTLTRVLVDVLHRIDVEHSTPPTKAG